MGEAPVLGNSLFSDALPHSDDVNINIGVGGVGDTRTVASRIQGHWGRFQVQVMIFLGYSSCQ